MWKKMGNFILTFSPLVILLQFGLLSLSLPLNSIILSQAIYTAAGAEKKHFYSRWWDSHIRKSRHTFPTRNLIEISDKSINSYWLNSIESSSRTLNETFLFTYIPLLLTEISTQISDLDMTGSMADFLQLQTKAQDGKVNGVQLFIRVRDPVAIPHLVEGLI